VSGRADTPGQAGVPRLVATDLDGTLVGADGHVSARTRAVLQAVEEAGVIVVFVTGRPLRWAELVFDDVGDHGVAIVANGALVWDVAASTSRLERPIGVEVVHRVTDALRAAVPGTSFALETMTGIGLEAGFTSRFPLPEGTRQGPLSELTDEAPVLKILARHEEHEPEDFWRVATEALGEEVVVTWSSASALLEISAAGVTKATSLALLCEELGIDAADVVAFGDMPNDLPMLTWAGRSWAMANAHPSVLAVADHVAPDHDEDGVAQVLVELVPSAARMM